jgi:hypothetical protein
MQGRVVSVGQVPNVKIKWNGDVGKIVSCVIVWKDLKPEDQYWIEFESSHNSRNHYTEGESKIDTPGKVITRLTSPRRK